MTTLAEIGKLAKARTDAATQSNKPVTPRYSKRHYKDMAAILNAAKSSVRSTAKASTFTDAASCVIDSITYGMTKLFEADNPRFDAGRFYRAVNRKE